MAKNVYFGTADLARKVNDVYLGVDGTARKVKKGYIGVDGVARLFYSSQSPGYGLAFWVIYARSYSSSQRDRLLTLDMNSRAVTSEIIIRNHEIFNSQYRFTSYDRYLINITYSAVQYLDPITFTITLSTPITVTGPDDNTRLFGATDRNMYRSNNDDGLDVVDPYNFAHIRSVTPKIPDSPTWIEYVFATGGNEGNLFVRRYFSDDWNGDYMGLYQYNEDTIAYIRRILGSQPRDSKTGSADGYGSTYLHTYTQSNGTNDNDYYGEIHDNATGAFVANVRDGYGRSSYSAVIKT